VSKWIANLVEERTQSAWPQAILDWAGALPDFPTAEELRLRQVPDTTREKF